MAVPRNRLSNARKNSRRAHHAKSPKQSCKCKNCGVAKLPHVACPSCGAYGNGVVVKTA
ncbi:50S ribosomal protein L32 [Estrella lausannensis]|uniref:Large ribosomal subunit protein bL32 n=1 Tax=Estrella lausannensis TaxID=483423 RepID=A0A0H5DNH7_9BACT|nr:50S ribosomal protein L32 [Estrella lausannensis]CRX37886.1 50S ribosomal protein L32 [Estrella lausannensis]